MSQPQPFIASAHQEWWRGAVIYQVYPRSFADSNGDGVGDLPGVTARLDYIASLGVDAVWLSPFFTSPQRDFGYDIADYRSVDRLFGTLDDFDRLLERAHKLGLRVIIDQVYSHTSDEHPWFKESRASRDDAKADWYVWADPKPDGSPPNNWQSNFHGPSWSWDARRKQYYLHNFLPGQPDLNLHNKEVQEAVLDVARFWLDRGVDGFRLDAVNFAMHDTALRDNPPVAPSSCRGRRPFDFQHHIYNQSHPDIPTFLSRLRRLIDSYGDRFTVAEVGGEHAEQEMKLFTQGSDRLNSAYGFTFLYAQSLTPELIHKTLDMWPGEGGEGWPSWAFSNHDAPRVVSRWAHGRDPKAVAALSMLLLMTLRGNTFLYQGEELGLPQARIPFERLRDPEGIANFPDGKGRDGARSPMPWRAEAPFAGFSTAEPWLPLDESHISLSVDRQEMDPESMLHLTRQLVALRQREAALRHGAVSRIEVPEPLLAFERSHNGARLLCVFNLGSARMPYELAPGWRIIESVGIDGDCGLAPLAGFVAKPG